MKHSLRQAQEKAPAFTPTHAQAHIRLSNVLATSTKSIAESAHLARVPPPSPHHPPTQGETTQATQSKPHSTKLKEENKCNLITRSTIVLAFDMIDISASCSGIIFLPYMCHRNLNQDIMSINHLSMSVNSDFI